MLKSIGIIGGDLRFIKLAESYANDGIFVYVYGLNNIPKNDFIINVNSIEKLCDFTDYVISSIPFSKDNIYLNAPCFEENVTLEKVIDCMKNKIFIAGKISNKIKLELENKNNRVIDLMEDEPLAIYNAIATVEGTIASVINNTDITLYKSNILILGYGRIGKILADRLKNFGANIYCEARSEKDIALINANGFDFVQLAELGNFLRIRKEDNNKKNKIHIIINTIPHMILNKEMLDLLEFETFILDLASKPGGVDFKYAKEKKINVDWNLGIPGKIAPKSAALFIKERIACLGTEV